MEGVMKSKSQQFPSILLFCLFLFLPPLLFAQSIQNRGMQAGVGNWMQIPDNPSIAIPVFTAEVWVKAHSGGLIVTRDVSSGTPSDWQLWFDISRNRLAFITAKTPPDAYYFTPDNSFLPGRWYHVALVVNGPAGTAKLYIDGNLIISPTFSSRNFDATTGLAWCGYFDNPGGAYLDGVIDEARYWNIERTQTQIRAAKDIDLPSNDRTGLMGWWRFCDSFEDYSGIGNHGQRQGNPQIVDVSIPFGITCDDDPCDSLDVVISGDKIFCRHDSTALTASDGFISYLWSTGEKTRSIVVYSAGWYTVQAIAPNGCPVFASIYVEEYPSPFVDAGPDIVVCSNVEATLGVMPYDPEYSYRWTPKEGLLEPDYPVTTIRTHKSGLYVLTVTTQDGCYASDTVHVAVLDGLDLLMPDSVHICVGSSVHLPLAVLSGEAPYTFEWSPSSTLSSVSDQNPSASPMFSQWYYVLVVDAKGCRQKDSLFVSVTEGLDTRLPDSLRICKGDSIQLPLHLLNGTPPFTFQWLPEETLDDRRVQQPIALPEKDTWYHVYVSDSLGCLGQDSVYVTISDELMTSLPDTIYVCPMGGVILPLEISGNEGPLEFRWTPENDLSDAHVQRPLVRPRETRMYYVLVVDSLGCEAVDSVMVDFFPKAEVSIRIDGHSRFCLGDSVRLFATPGYSSYRWHTPSGIISDTGNSIIAREGGRYHVVVVDRNGCEVISSPVTITTFMAFAIAVSLHGSQPLCEGDSVRLEAEPGYSSYEWSDGNGRSIGLGRSIMVAASGRYTVIARDSANCTGNSAPIEVFFGKKPDVKIMGPRTVCINSTHMYSTWYQSRWEYKWTTIGGDFLTAEHRETVRIQWTDEGSATLKLVVRDLVSGCIDSVMVPITVITEIQPDVYAEGGTVICKGDSLRLFSRDTYATMSWRNSAGELLGTERSLMVGSTGIYYFFASTDDGCGGMDSVLVTVLDVPKPRIAGPIAPCQGDTASYVMSEAGSEFSWLAEEGRILERDSARILLHWDRPGVFHLIVRASIQGASSPCHGSDTLTVVVHPRPEPLLLVSPDSMICEGDSALLTATPGFQLYRWVTPSGSIDTSSHELRVTTPGLYRVTVVSSEGCEASTGFVAVTVHPNPDIEIDGPRSLCQGEHGTYSVSETLNSMYSWQVTGGSFESNPQDTGVKVRWHDAGVGVLTVVAENGFCTSHDTFLVHIGDSILPVIQADGPLQFCSGGEVILDAGQGYAFYEWRTPDGIFGDQRIVARRAGEYTVRVRSSSGCEGTSEAVRIEEFPSPNPLISGPDGVCPGDTALLEAEAGYVSYQWSDGGSGRFHSMMEAGVRSVTVIDSNGCTGTSEFHRLALYPVPASPGILRDGNMFRSTPAASYQWFRNDTLLDGETSRECSISLPGMYRVVVHNEHGCFAMSEEVASTCLQGRSIVALPDLLVAPGDTVTLDPYLMEAICIEEAGARQFTARLRFDQSLLVPLEGTPKGWLSGQDRIIDLRGSVTDLQKREMRLRFMVTLGATDHTPLWLDMFEWVDAPVTAERVHGSLRLIICREGGARLFRSEGQVRLSQNRPNPFNSVTVIEYEVIEAAHTELFVLNALGQRVRLLFEGYHEKGTYQQRFDATDLPSGPYYLVLRTPTVVLHRIMSLVK
jgi:hypothetical protein